MTSLLRDHLPAGVQGNPRPGTMLSQRTVHPSFDCSQPFCSSFRCSWRFVGTQDKAASRQPGILCGWSPGTVYHWIFVPHLHYRRSKTCSRHIFSHVLTSLANVSQNMTSEHCTAPLYIVTIHVNAHYKLSFYYYYNYYYLLLAKYTTKNASLNYTESALS